MTSMKRMFDDLEERLEKKIVTYAQQLRQEWADQIRASECRIADNAHAAQSAERPWREREMNPRSAPLHANRIATYTEATGVRIRFLYAVGMIDSKLDAGDNVLELFNVADVGMSPIVAKRMLVDLGAAVNGYERAFGEIPEHEEANRRFNQSQAAAPKS